MSIDLKHYRSMSALHQASTCLTSVEKAADSKSGPWIQLGTLWCLPCLIIRLIIHTIRLDRTRSVWTDEASNVSRLDPSGAVQTDAQHQATDLVLA
jgi:hypothetical protein